MKVSHLVGAPVANLIQPLLDLKLAVQFGCCSAAADFIHRVLTNSTYRLHLAA